MVTDKFPNGLIGLNPTGPNGLIGLNPTGPNGPIGLNPNGLIGLNGPIGPNRHSRPCTLLSTPDLLSEGLQMWPYHGKLFVVRRVPSATLGKNATDG